ncbi:MAG: hypothetical protein JSV88_04985 [Candidatus Aminicenantes bacterium]|nr:MAG: hypothetical protein JSV88_04985 [Candidatus Aminicenantes bacterium]
MILDHLKLHAREKNELLKSITRYLPGDFNFCDYSRVWRYDSSPGYARGFSVDIFARAQSPHDYSIIGEVKSRDLKKFSKDEVVHFLGKFEAIKKIENLDRVIGFIFFAAVLPKKQKITARKRVLRAAKMRGGWALNPFFSKAFVGVRFFSCHEITFASGGQGALFEKTAPWTPTKAFD